MTIVERNSKIVLYAHFLAQNGEEATISGTPTIDIYHFNNSVINDVSSENMTQVSGTLYYYEHFVAANSDETNYIAKFSASYSDGTSAVGSESFQVVRMNFFKRAASGGPVVSGKTIIKDIWTTDEKKNIIDAISNLKTKIDSISIENIGTINDLSSMTGKIKKDVLMMKVLMEERPNQMQKYTNEITDMKEKVNENINEINKEIFSLSGKISTEQKTLLKEKLDEIKLMNISKNNTFNTIFEKTNEKIEKLETLLNELSQIVIKQADTTTLESIGDKNAE